LASKSQIQGNSDFPLDMRASMSQNKAVKLVLNL